MLDRITCDTPISAIIKVEDAIAKFDSLEEIITQYKSDIETSVNSEITTGGLNKKYFSVKDTYPLYDSANRLVDDIDIGDETTKLKDYMVELVTLQRRKEIDKLIDKVKEKISNLQKEYDSLVNIIDEIKSFVSKDPTKYIKNKDALNLQIKYYKDKLTTLEGMN